MSSHNITLPEESRQQDCINGLYTLLQYAIVHPHSRQWIAPIILLLQRSGVAYG